MGSDRGLTELDSYLRAVRASAATGADPQAAVRTIALDLLGERGIDPPAGFLTAAGDAPDVPLPPAPLRSPWLLGQVHETLLDPSVRRRSGAHYTPPAVARALVAFARAGHDRPAPTVCDPAAGGGAFLLAAAESLAAEGVDRSIVVREHLRGGDVDPMAVDVARAALALWAGEWPDCLERTIVVADALRSPSVDGPVDLVVGNPPFQNQLDAGTARGLAGTDELRVRFGSAAKGYVDSAALFLLAGLDLVNEGGRVALVQPHSTIAARDAAGVRAAIVERGSLVGVWFTDEKVFAADVRVWAPVIQRGHVAPAVRRRTGASFEAASDVDASSIGADSWAPLVADLTGVPDVQVRSAGTVGDIATATAGFRDQYYGLVGAIREAGAGEAGERSPLRLVTSGLIEPLDVAWGRVPVRFAGQRWQRPVVLVDEVDPSIDRWVRAQLVPKLVVATQTRVVEVAVDEDGRIVPSTPVIAVHAPPERLWHLAAALSAPPVTALALRTSVGTALSAGAVKLSARQVLALPLPSDEGAWDDAAALAQRAAATVDRAKRLDALAAFGEAGCAAYGVASDGLLEWWLDRLPVRDRVQG